jgi:hypothetical protein
MTYREQSELRVSVSHDPDDECYVTATLTSGPFRGIGRAYLPIGHVSEFASATKQLASTSTGKAVLRGEYINQDGSRDYIINLSLLPHGRRGHILLMVELSSGPPALEAEVRAISRVSTVLIIDPAALDRFANRLLGISEGGNLEAVVQGESATFD